MDQITNKIPPQGHFSGDLITQFQEENDSKKLLEDLCRAIEAGTTEKGMKSPWATKWQKP